ncbi:MAG: S8 family serine peptidase [Chryseolinea sp.]
METFQLSHRVRCSKFLAAFILFCLSSLFVFGQNQQDVQPGKLRIKVSEEFAARLSRSRMGRSSSNVVICGIQSLDEIHKKFSVHEFKRVFRDAGFHEARHRKYGLHLWYEVNMPATSKLDDVMAAYKGIRQIEKVEPVYYKHIIGSGNKDYGPVSIDLNQNATEGQTTFPDDPLFFKQWHYHNTGQTGGTPGADIHLKEAWRMQTGKRNIVVAVMDGGIQYDHPDLAANMWINTSEIATNNIDDDHNGYVDDIYGYGFGDDTGNISPDEHGTHVAGTIAAVTNNGIGVSGIAGGSGHNDGTLLMSCAVFGLTNTDNFPEAYVYAADMGAVISQNSWGYDFGYEQVVLDAIDYFIAEAGHNDSGIQTGPIDGGVVIFASGNSDWEYDSYPAFYEPVIAVSATNHFDMKAWYSNFGLYVDISAPGGETEPVQVQGVLSTLSGSGYGFFQGTSMACPHVSGAAALILAKFGGPGFTRQSLRNMLTVTADNIYSLNPDYKKKLGYGRLNVKNALHFNDYTPPVAIGDLQVINQTQTALSVHWTSPSDPGDLPVASYDFRYSTEPITATNFNQATAVTVLPSGDDAGTEIHFTLPDLLPETLYYVALKSADSFGNISALSNVVSATTDAPSALIVHPASFSASLVTAETVERSMIIVNAGAGPLRTTIESSEHVLAEPATATIPAGDSIMITISIRANNLLAGVYSEVLHIISNAPEGTFDIPVNLSVANNGYPIISVSPGTLNFENTIIHTTTAKKIAIRNNGSENLSIGSVSSDNAQMQIEFSEGVVLVPFDTISLPVLFTPEAVGFTSGIISVASNDPASPIVQLAVSGSSYDPFGGLVVFPEVLNDELLLNEKSTQKMSLYNTGTSTIDFQTEVKSDIIFNTNTLFNARSGQRKSGITKASSFVKKQRKDSISGPQFMPAVKTVAGASSPLKILPLATTYQYATDFESFSIGPLIHQEGWYTYDIDGWEVSQVNPARGQNHVRLVPIFPDGYAFSPLVAIGQEAFSSMSVKININESGNGSWVVMGGSITSGYVVTRIIIDNSGNMSALISDGINGYYFAELPVKAPSGYFELTLEVERASHIFYIYVNDELVFSETGFAGDIEQAIIGNIGISSETFIDVDDFRLIDGGHEGIEYAHVNPVSGTILPGDSLELIVDFDASNLPYGNFESQLLIKPEGLETKSIPISLTVTGDPAFEIAPQLLSIFLTKGDESTSFIHLRNTGGKVLNFSISSADTTWLLVKQKSVTLPIGYYVNIPIGIKSQSLMAGIHTSTVTFSAGGIDFLLPVELDLGPPGSIFVQQDTLFFETTDPYSNEAGTQFTIQNTGEGILNVHIDANTSISSPSEWSPFDLTMDPVNTGPNSISAISNHAGFPAEGYYYDHYFGEYVGLGPLDGQDNWAADDEWTVVSPYYYNVDIRGLSNGTGEPAYAFSPRVTPGNENTSWFTFTVNSLYSKGSTWQIIPQSLTKGKVVTRLQINPDQSFQILVPDENGNPVFQKIPTKMPEGSYMVEILVDRLTLTFSVFINGLRVYTGKSFVDHLDQVAFLSLMEEENSVFYIEGDNMYVNGGASRFSSSFLSESNNPTILPGEQLTFFPGLSARDLPIGIYRDSLHIFSNDPDHPEMILPYSLNVTRSFVRKDPGNLQISLDTIKATIREGETGIRNFTMTNTGNSETSYYLPQDFFYGYKAHNVSFHWEDISSKGENLNLGDDDYRIVPMDFKFPFYDYKGESEEVLISSNGYLIVNLSEVLNTYHGDDPANRCINNFESDRLQNVIAPYWEDHVIDQYAGVYFWGDSSRFIVQYTNVLLFGTNLRNTFQVILFPDGKIRFAYLNMHDRQSATIGVGVDPYGAGNDAEISCNEPYVTDSLSVQIELPMPWMKFSPNSGNVNPGEIQSVEVKLGFNEEVFGEYYWWNLPVIGKHEGYVFKQTYYSDYILFAEAIPVSLTVLENPAPVFGPLENLIIAEGKTIDLTVTATDNDSIVTIMSENLPDFVTLIHSENGSATFRISPIDGDADNMYGYYLNLIASDVYGKKTYGSLHIAVVRFQVQDFSLIYTNSGIEVKHFQDTVVLDIADPDIEKYTIRANTFPTRVGSVQFILDGKYVNTRNTPPYVINSWVLPVLSEGSHTLTAKPFGQSNAKGEEGPESRSIINVINSAAITGFDVVRNNGKKLMDLQEGGIIDLSQPGFDRINVIAKTSINTVRSVKFAINGVTVRIDNKSPYGVYGNSKGIELPWPIHPGRYTLSAMPFMKYYGYGPQGIPLTVNFRIVNGSVPTVLAETEAEYTLEVGTTESGFSWSVYPVPVTDDLNLKLTGDITGNVVMTIRNTLGQQVYSETSSAETFQDYTFSTVNAGFTSGVYFIQIQYESGKRDVIRIIHN